MVSDAPLRPATIRALLAAAALLAASLQAGVNLRRLISGDQPGATRA